jgi:hypothetical protein
VIRYELPLRASVSCLFSVDVLPLKNVYVIRYRTVVASTASTEERLTDLIVCQKPL